MCSHLVDLNADLQLDLRPYPWVRIALVVALTLLLSGWSCMGEFKSCPGAMSAQINSLSPGDVPGDAEEVLLTVNGNGFTPQSQILWNGNALPTALTDSHHLHAAITQQTFASFGGSPGSTVQISVRSQGSDTICPPSGNTAALDLVIE